MSGFRRWLICDLKKCATHPGTQGIIANWILSKIEEKK